MGKCGRKGGYEAQERVSKEQKHSARNIKRRNIINQTALRIMGERRLQVGIIPKGREKEDGRQKRSYNKGDRGRSK